MTQRMLWLGLPALVIILLTGCTIEEYTGPVSGNLFVTAADDSGNVVIGASIYLDGLLRSELTPDTLKNVLSGAHALRIEKYGYQLFEDPEVVVEPYIVSNYQANLTFSDVGAMCVMMTNGPGLVIVDGQTIGSVQSNIMFPEIPVGMRNVSAFRNGYFTSPATLVPVNVNPLDTASVSFTLTQGTIGSDVDNVAPMFTLINDNSDSVSLHNYRGRVVLIDFWFRT